MFNPYTNMYQNPMYNQSQPIQRMGVPSQQIVCYPVNSKEDMQNIQPTVGVLYVGINKQTQEIYTRAWNNNGLIDFDTYALSKGEQEVSELKTILDKLNKIEIKMKEISHERNVADVNKPTNVGNVTEQSNDGSI